MSGFDLPKAAVALLYDGWKIADFLQSARCQIVSQSNLAGPPECRTTYSEVVGGEILE